jgi:hypothetical protein
LIDEGMNGKIEAHNVEFEYQGKIYKGAEFVIVLNSDITRQFEK